jgi:methylmalonyl-CoA/ethylmalonyl-CoA epimerase
MENLILHHVGIVVHDEEVVKQFCKLFNLKEDYRGYVPEYNALCIFMRGNGKSSIEFVIPSNGKLKDFNGGKGGLHHIAFKTSDLNKAKTELEQNNVKFIQHDPVKGAGNFVVNFTKPKSSKRILVELIEMI